MKIIKRDGSEEPFNVTKIVNAITKANREIPETARISDLMIEAIADEIASELFRLDYAPDIEEIQNKVIIALNKHDAYVLALAYSTYRTQRAMIRKSNTTDDRILSLLERQNEEVNQENANKNPMVNSVQRDYMAGEVSKDLTKRRLLPLDIVKAHEAGIIHFHDADYFAQHMHNCCLCNLEDVLQNGTVISETMIEKPNSFATACNVATQVIAQVSSAQYGGQTISLAHLVPFVDVSRKKLAKQIREEMEQNGICFTEEQLTNFVEERLKKEVKAGIQTIQYQVITLLTTNGQAPFLSVFMYLAEVPEGQARDDLAMIIEEMLKQRILGVKNEKGVYVTPAFPKLLYVLEEDNIREDSKYWYLTRLAAECTAERMVPDYISEKVMKELKGDTYPCMGCVDGEEVITYKLFGKLYVESFRRMWQRLSNHFAVQEHKNGKHMDVENVEIYDHKSGFTNVRRVIRNSFDKWMRIRFSGREITCTEDHPFETKRGVVLAKDLDDVISFDQESDFVESDIPFNTDRAWLLGLLLCNSIYCDKIAVVADDAAERVRRIFSREYALDTKTFVRSDGHTVVQVLSDNSKDFLSFKAMLMAMFEGKAKADRHIPNEVFGWCKEARLAFLDGMTGAQSKEVALQKMVLAQTLGMVTAQSEGRPVSIERLDKSGFSYDVTTDSEHFTVSGIYSHNCRSFLTPDTVGMNEDKSHKYYGRFNQGVVTINLPHVALSSGGDETLFWEIFEERLELCHKALRCRHERLLGTVSDVAPILWQYGALARLKKGETIDKLLYDNYSTISLGYAGLYECVRYMTGKSHTDPEGKPFAIAVMQKMNDKCAEWRAAENISYSLYGTPMESTTYKFAKANRRDFGMIPHVTDKNYITNSYHVHVTEKIDAFTKLTFESEFQALSPGGAISYVEVPDLKNNIDAVLAVIKHIYDNIMYAELNTKSDYCQECGYDGEIQIVEEDGKLYWECPNCGNRNQNTMNIARRTCGYIGSQYWNQGRTQEIKDRVLHL